MSRSVAVAPEALRVLVTGVVDYAGLFPPAALDMASAVANFATYRASDDAWVLGRFVLNATRLDEWSAAVNALSASESAAWHGARLSALLSGEFSRESERIAAFNDAAALPVRIDVAEARTHTIDSVLATAAAMPDDVTLYCEIPHRDDPAYLLDAVHSAGVRAKIRTGGVTPDAFPMPGDIVRFLRRCVERGVTAKATAGLHHPLRGDFRLTYQPDAVRGMMYGFVNVFLCAAALRVGVGDAVAGAILLEQDAETIVASAEAVRYVRGGVLEFMIDRAALTAFRETGLVAFGSCSFREPVDELAMLFA